MSSATDKILLHLYDCINYGFSYRMKNGLFILDEFSHGRIKTDKIKNNIRDLNKLKFIRKKENYDGSILVSLTEKGQLRALNLSFRNLYNKKEKWDGKWRMVTFDIPNKYKKGRDALRYRLRLGGFYEFQKSLFLYPYNCEREIRDFVDLFRLKGYVSFALIDSIDNEEDIKLKMNVE